jgi:chemotaxis protein MotB
MSETEHSTHTPPLYQGPTMGGDMGAKSEDDWLVTYADAITLLMAFFVLLYTTATPDTKKFDEISAAISTQFKHGAPAKKRPDAKPDAKPDAPRATDTTQKTAPDRKTSSPDEAKQRAAFDQIIKKVHPILTRELAKSEARVERVPNGLIIQFSARTLYASGSAKILKKMVPLMERVSDAIGQHVSGTPNIRINVEGHTDDQKLSNQKFRSNWELSALRATTIVRFLINRNINPRQLTATGYANTKPLKGTLDGSGRPIPKKRALNRRVVIRLERIKPVYRHKPLNIPGVTDVKE